MHAAAGFSSDVATQAGHVAAHAGAIAVSAAEQAGEICRKVIEASWKVCHFQALPHWLQDNDYLIWGHRYTHSFYFYTKNDVLCHVFPITGPHYLHIQPAFSLYSEFTQKQETFGLI